MYTEFKLVIWGCNSQSRLSAVYNIHQTVSYMTTCRYSFRKKVNDGEENCTVRCLIIYSLHQNATGKIERNFFPTSQISAGPTLQSTFITLSKGYYPFNRLSSYRHRLLNIPTHGIWRNAGRRSGGALNRRLSAKEEKKTPYILHKHYIKYILSYFNCHIPAYMGRAVA